MRLNSLRALLALLALPLLASASLGDERAALVKARQDAAEADRRALALERDAAGAEDLAAQARARSTAVAARIQAAEAGIAAANARVAIVGAMQRAQAARLAEKQGPLIRLTAALQLMTRRPALVTLARPGSTADLVHVRALLASVMPVVRERTAGLRAEVARGRALKRSADLAATSLRDGRARLEGERLQLARLEAAERARARRFANSAMFEADRATALGEEARDLTTLMGEIEGQAGIAARLARLPGPVLRPDRPGDVAAPQASARVQRNPPYRLPVIGEVVSGLGEVSAEGVRARGLTIATAPGAIAVAPTRGRVAFAAPYRGYGRIVIIDHGEGWTTLITGLDALDVGVGEAVERGSPLGRAGTSRPRVTVELRRAGRPIDITPLVS